MRDWESERDKPVVDRVYHEGTGTIFTREPLKPYNELIEALFAAAKEFSVTSEQRARMRKLAWFLGMRGEAQACQAIMRWATEPAYKWSDNPAGWPIY